MSLKQPPTEKYYKILEILFNTMPYVFWKDTSGKYQGGNLNQAQSFGFSSAADFIGKTIFEILSDQDAAKAIDETDNQIMKEDLSIVNEEKIETSDGEKYYLSQKSALHDDDGVVIGLIGFAMDITEIKQKEKITNAKLKATEEREKKALLAKAKEAETRVCEQEKFIKVAGQVAHDIRSPLASLTMVIKSCTEIPEAERIAIREAATNIGDIANSLLKRFTPDSSESDSSAALEVEAAPSEPLLVSTMLMQLMTDKKYEFPAVQWTLDVTPNAHFAFIAVGASGLRRSLSNLINNAVDASTGGNDCIFVRLEVDEEAVLIRIEDNGQGMPNDVLEKIKNEVAVTAGKADGHGIGLSQVRGTLQQYQGRMEIESTLGQGTQVTLRFPRIDVPNWMAERITLMPEDTVIILDDDSSIHGAWDAHFQSLLKACPSIQLKHFSNGQDALDFIQSHTPKQKQHLFLLTDYELLKQDLDGLTVIEKSQLSRTVLVTSHYANPVVRERAATIGNKILPKQMASEITIDLEQPELAETDMIMASESVAEKTVDAVLVDDDMTFVKNLMLFVFDDCKVDTYTSPEGLLEHVAMYSKDTLFLLDNQFKDSDYSGIDLAKKLHEQGYTQLYLLSGQTFEAGKVPDYVTVIRKDDIDRLKQLL